MDFFNKLGKKASEAYKTTADKTGKIAKETKLKFRMGELKSKIEDIYGDIGKKVYEKHVQKEEFTKNDVLEECKQIDEMSEEIESIRKDCLELRDKKICQKCFKEIDKNMKFCPECGAQQEEAKEVEVLESSEKSEENSNAEDFEKEESSQENTEARTNLEKTIEVEINPDAKNITGEEMKNIGQ